MRDGERRDNRNESTEPAERDHEAHQEQQVVRAVQDVVNPRLTKLNAA
jgi:hypothetical protein